MAKNAKLSGLSITDHDTLQAYTDEVMSYAKQLNLKLLHGVEVSSELDGLTVHILAYSIRNTFQLFLNQVVEKRNDRNRRILEKLKKRGISISEEDLHSTDSKQIIGRLHIAKVLIRKKAVATLQEAFERYLSDTASCFAPGEKFSPSAVIDAIHREGGLAVLAHPHFLKRGRFLEKILALPFDGMECYYGRLLKAQEAPWIRIAQERHWIVTGGSDYHGDSNCPIGTSWVDEATFQRLLV